jgi:hypothetical protein
MLWYWFVREGAPCIRLSPLTAAELRRTILDAFLALPKRGVEIGGWLLGHIEAGDPPVFQVEAFEEIPCEHQFGPAYVFSDHDRAGLTASLSRPRPEGTPAIIGMYRSFTSREPTLEKPEEESIVSHFPNPDGLFLLLQPVSPSECRAMFRFRRGHEILAASTEPLLAFPTGLMAMKEASPTAEPRDAVRGPIMLPPGRRPLSGTAERARVSKKPRFWLPWIACLLVGVVGAGIYEWWTLNRPSDKSAAALPPKAIAESVIPPPAIQPPTATAPPISPPAAPAPTPRKAAAPVRSQPSQHRTSAIAVPPTVVHEVQPGIAPGIRARIRERIVIPVRVRVSSSGKVTGSSAGQRREADSVYQYLAERATVAARLWRFSPATAVDGTRIAADRTIYFVFTP